MLPRMIWTLSFSSILAVLAATASAQNMTAPELSSAGFNAPSEAWRTVDPENLLIIETNYGKIGVELLPEIAPKHVAQIKALTRQDFYNDVAFHRVIDGFMNQTGDAVNGNGTGDSTLPNIPSEFTFKRGKDMPFMRLTTEKFDQREFGVGFYKSLPIASQPDVDSFILKDKAGKAEAFGLHCKGVTSMARAGGQINSGNSQFFLMRGKKYHLNRDYSIWGNTVMGYDLLEKPKVGVIGEIPGWIPDRMNTAEIAADMAEAERPTVQVLKTGSAAFNAWLNTQRQADGTLPDVCDLQIPTRTL